MDSLQEAKKVIDTEVEAISFVESKLNNSFNELIECISRSSGRVVMCGMGKSGHIAKKIFSTLASTGTPSIFMHPAEAFHGDLGMIKKEDIFFAISNSGETSEVSQLLPFIKNNCNLLISMTGNPKSTIASCSDYHIDIGVEKEACPLNLAPTASTTVSLVIGDAIAVALMKSSNFKKESFARYHPGGALGQRLLMTVKDMLLPITFITPDITLMDVVSEMSSSNSGVIVVGDKSNVKGIITDGDIKRAIRQVRKEDVFDLKASQIMSNKPEIIMCTTRCIDADNKMKEIGINSLLVLEKNDVIGVYDNLNRKV